MGTTRTWLVFGLLFAATVLLLAAPAAKAQTSDGDRRPSYYTEDYSGPNGRVNETSKVAYIRLRVPAGAELWINGERRAKQTGSVREFVTPALDPDHVYVYMVRARWTEEGGIRVEKSLRVRTIAGTRVTVNFARPPAEQARQVVQAPPPLAPRVEQRPVSWTSSVAPRSFSPSRP